MMNSKTALVTGGTSGVGLSIVKTLVAQGYHVYFIGTQQGKGQQIEKDIKASYGNKATFIAQDLSDLSSLYALSHRLLRELDHLDVLANVAGVILPQAEKTPEGFDRTFSIGYLSSFILSTQLAPLLEKATPGRIVNVGASPSVLFKTKLNLELQDFSKHYKSFGASIASTHAKTVLTSILAQKYKIRQIDVNSFHPGMVKSGLMRHQASWMQMLGKVFSPFMSDTCPNGVHVCTASEVSGITGKLFVNKMPIALDFDTSYQQKLWDATVAMLAPIINTKNL